MAKQKNRKVKYSGVLATPMTLHLSPPKEIDPSTLPAGKSPIEWRHEDADKNVAQFFQRLDALFNHFGLQFGDFTKLALELAHEHVPGFRYRSPGEKVRGRPSSIGTTEDLFERMKQFWEIIPLAEKKGLIPPSGMSDSRRGFPSVLISDSMWRIKEVRHGSAYRLAGRF